MIPPLLLSNLNQTFNNEKAILPIGSTRAQICLFDNFIDLRGELSVLEFSSPFPFNPKRIFYIYNVPLNQERGHHAHVECHQFFIQVKGTCTLKFDDGNETHEIVLNTPKLGVYLPPLIWSYQYNFSPDSVLLVLASDFFLESDYLRNYDDFLEHRKPSLS